MKSDNLEVLRWGEPKTFDFEAKDHVELGERLQQLDGETAGKITGSRFTVMYGDLARLHRALIQFMLNLHTQEHGYSESLRPVSRESQIPCSGLDSCPNSRKTCSSLSGDQGLYLSPTAEVPVTNIARDRIFEDSELG